MRGERVWRERKIGERNRERGRERERERCRERERERERQTKDRQTVRQISLPIIFVFRKLNIL